MVVLVFYRHGLEQSMGNWAANTAQGLGLLPEVIIDTPLKRKHFSNQ